MDKKQNTCQYVKGGIYFLDNHLSIFEDLFQNISWQHNLCSLTFHDSTDNLCSLRIEGLPFICLHEIKDKQLSNIYFGILYHQRYRSLKLKILSRFSVRKKTFPFLKPFISQLHIKIELSYLCGTSLMFIPHIPLICTCELQFFYCLGSPCRSTSCLTMLPQK